MGLTITAAKSYPTPRPIPAMAHVADGNPHSDVAASRAQPPEREKLLVMHLPQVRLVAESIRARLGFTVGLDDLIGYGVIGLMKAVERFDPSRGILLKTYAEHRIRGAILDGVRGMDWLSRGARRKERLAQRSLQPTGRTRCLSNGNGCRAAPFRKTKVPNPGARGEAVGGWVPRLQLINAGADLEDLERLSERAGWRDSIEGSGDTPETLYQRKEIERNVAQAISGLAPRHRRVIELYYHKELSMKQIGQLLNVHESRVSQLHRLAIERLRKCLSGGNGSGKHIRTETTEGQL